MPLRRGAVRTLPGLGCRFAWSFRNIAPRASASAGGPRPPFRCIARRPSRCAAPGCGAPRRARRNCTKLMPSTPLSTSSASSSPLRLPAGRSICVTSPFTTIFELKPWRVSTIFICSAVLFCASSRMMKLSFSVRPRMKAMGATSIDVALQQLLHLLGFQHVVQGVVERAQIRVHLFLQACRAESRAARRLRPPDASE